jgi:hypothetical protein
MPSSTFTLEHEHHHVHAHAANLPSPPLLFDSNSPKPEAYTDIKPLSRSTSYSLKTGVGPRVVSRTLEAPSPHEGLGIYDQDHLSSLGDAMRGKTRARPRGESDLGRPAAVVRPIGNGSVFTSVPEVPLIETPFV